MCAAWVGMRGRGRVHRNVCARACVWHMWRFLKSSASHIHLHSHSHSLTRVRTHTHTLQSLWHKLKHKVPCEPSAYRGPSGERQGVSGDRLPSQLATSHWIAPSAHDSSYTYPRLPGDGLGANALLGESRRGGILTSSVHFSLTSRANEPLYAVRVHGEISRTY